MIVLISLFYDLLDNYSRGKFMKIQTDKPMTGRQKKEKGREEGGEDAREEDSESSSEEEVCQMYQERRFTMESEFA